MMPWLDISSPTHDEFHVYMTSGSNEGREVFVGSVVQSENGPVWVPATGKRVGTVVPAREETANES